MIKSVSQRPSLNFSSLNLIPCFQLEKPVQFGWYEKGVEDKDHKVFVENQWPAIFSKRETEILELLNTGQKFSDIAACLFISEKTVKKHISNARKKVPQENKNSLLEFFEESKL
ncbi:helix-turn-helix transcriptional regulator [Cryomorpha ignava]|uniref:Helix-turn-helix transcriptional regulator n=2 Tax=Cryomorpha ignava TaxID=101383 RepID=A0A7K3WUJ2_9FLAO|nr:helix-turn-helix transcriptional regulator [Cryomorpha ignava]